MKGIREIDHGWNRIEREIGRFKSKVVAVGFFEGEEHLGKKGEGEAPVAQIAAAHEYGVPSRKIPERSFMRSWVAHKKSKITAFIARLLAGVEEGSITAEQALKKLGVYGVSGMKNRIRTGDFKELSELTIKRKGSSKPLIDTGQMINSLEYEVRELGDSGK